jgi:F0F1-type ATP synthase membrane subunit a
MSATRRGLLIFGGLVLVVAFGCYYLPFVVLPRAGQGVALPVITPAPEVFGSIFGIQLTGTLTSMVIVDILVILIAVVVGRAIRRQPADRFVPRGLSNAIEMLAEFFYNQAYSLLGKYTRAVFPLATSLFFMIFIANMIKLVPGVESVGIISCVEQNQAGYAVAGTTTGPDGKILPQAGMWLLNSAEDIKKRSGVKATEEDVAACEAKYPWAVPPKNAGNVAAHSEAATTADKPASYAQGQTPVTTTEASSANPDVLNVIPFFRGLSTDLNMTLAMAVLIFVMSEAWGFQAFGIPYMFKFINVPALGNIAKKPMGVMDFVVGLFEIVSELSRLVSLSFRLFGAILAGGVLLLILSFLSAFFVPLPIYFLEIILGTLQAYVPAILTIIYAQQAVTSHHEEEHAKAHSA